MISVKTTSKLCNNYVAPSEGSMPLTEKWSLRRYVVPLERIDVAETSSVWKHLNILKLISFSSMCECFADLDSE